MKSMALRDAPLVCVIVLNWNGRVETLDCIESLHKSDYSNFRILLVDNASSDDTVTAVKNEFPDVEILENSTNLGYAEGNNVGIRYAIDRGAEFLFVLNNDTVVDKSAITALVIAATQNGDTPICCPLVYNYNASEQVDFGGYSEAEFNGFNWKSGALKTASTQDLACRIPTAFATGSALFFSEKVVLTSGCFDSRFFIYWEDTDWCYRARRAGHRSFVVPAARIRHKGSQSFAALSRRPIYHYYFYRNRFLWIEKNLRGFARLRAVWRSLRGLVHPLLPLPWTDAQNSRRSVFRARWLGLTDYCMRRFGPYRHSS
jgi:GT2 family glycosyltransferase